MEINQVLSAQPNVITNIGAASNSKKPDLTNQQRQRIYELLLESTNKGKLPYGVFGKLSKKFNIHPKTVSRIWHQGQQSIRDGMDCANVASRKATNSGRKKLPLDLNLIERLPSHQRTSLQTMATHTNISKSRLCRALQQKLIKKQNDVYIVVKARSNK